MAKAASSPWMKGLSRMVPVKIPIGPPLPTRELVKLLKRIRATIDHAIVALEKSSKPARKRKVVR